MGLARIAVMENAAEAQDGFEFEPFRGHDGPRQDGHDEEDENDPFSDGIGFSEGHGEGIQASGGDEGVKRGGIHRGIMPTGEGGVNASGYRGGGQGIEMLLIA